MSLITELTKQLNDRSNCCELAGDYKTRSLLKEASNLITELSEKLHNSQMERSSQYYHGGWIPCNERLPEEGKLVLVWYEYYRYGNYNRMYQTYGIGYQCKGFWGGDVIGTNARCIAWMPLHPAWKEGAE